MPKCFSRRTLGITQPSQSQPPSSHHDNTDLAQLGATVSSCHHISGVKNIRGQRLLCFIDYIFWSTSFCQPLHSREAWSLLGVLRCVTFNTTRGWVTRVTSGPSLSDKLWHWPAWQQIPGPGTVTLREAREEMLLARLAAWSLGLIASLCEILKQSWEDVARDKRAQHSGPVAQLSLISNFCSLSLYTHFLPPQFPGDSSQHWTGSG